MGELRGRDNDRERVGVGIFQGDGNKAALSLGGNRTSFRPTLKCGNLILCPFDHLKPQRGRLVPEDLGSCSEGWSIHGPEDKLASGGV